VFEVATYRRLHTPRSLPTIFNEAQEGNTYRHRSQLLTSRYSGTPTKMQADNASTIDSLRKEKNEANDVDAAVRPASRVGSHTGIVDIEDAVFGAIGEDGPNYRNVSLLRHSVDPVLIGSFCSWVGQAQPSSW
jgi:hypothetical protein